MEDILLDLFKMIGPVGAAIILYAWVQRKKNGKGDTGVKVRVAGNNTEKIDRVDKQTDRLYEWVKQLYEWHKPDHPSAPGQKIWWVPPNLDKSIQELVESNREVSRIMREHSKDEQEFIEELRKLNRAISKIDWKG